MVVLLILKKLKQIKYKNKNCKKLNYLIILKSKQILNIFTNIVNYKLLKFGKNSFHYF